MADLLKEPGILNRQIILFLEISVCLRTSVVLPSCPAISGPSHVYLTHGPSMRKSTLLA